MTKLKLRASIQHDQYEDGANAFAFIRYSSGTDGYRIAEIKEGQCDLCERALPVLQMDNGEAGPYSLCKECIAAMWDAAENRTIYANGQ